MKNVFLDMFPERRAGSMDHEGEEKNSPQISQMATEPYAGGEL